MNIKDFVLKYELSPVEAEGLKEAAKFWARSNFEEKLLILVYCLTFGIFPGGVDSESFEEELVNNFSQFINDNITSPNLLWSSLKTNTEISNAVSNLSTALQNLISDSVMQEKTERENADQNLSGAILAEIENREGAVSGVQGNLSEHENRNDNPHSVTKEQVGLGNVLNVTQLTEADVIDSDTSSSTNKPVSAAQVASLRQSLNAIQDLLEEGGGNSGQSGIFVYQPNDPNPSGSIFANWSTLCEAVSSLPKGMKKIVYISDKYLTPEEIAPGAGIYFTTVPFEDGTYNLDGTIIESWKSESSYMMILDFSSNGFLISGLSEFRKSFLRLGERSSPFINIVSQAYTLVLDEIEFENIVSASCSIVKFQKPSSGGSFGIHKLVLRNLINYTKLSSDVHLVEFGDNVSNISIISENSNIKSSKALKSTASINLSIELDEKSTFRDNTHLNEEGSSFPDFIGSISFSKKELAQYYTKIQSDNKYLSSDQTPSTPLITASTGETALIDFQDFDAVFLYATGNVTVDLQNLKIGRELRIFIYASYSPTLSFSQTIEWENGIFPAFDPSSHFALLRLFIPPSYPYDGSIRILGSMSNYKPSI